MSKALKEGLEIRVTPMGRFMYVCDLDEKIDDGLFIPEDYTKDYLIEAVTGEDNKTVAEMIVTVFDEEMIDSCREDIVEIADDMDGDVYENIGLLTTTEEYEIIPDDFCLIESWVGYIRRCYVYPEFRNKGVATYLLENLALILKRGDSINLRCVSIYPRPQNMETGEYTDNPEMLNLMKHTFIKAGFKNVRDSLTYVKAYPFPALWLPSYY